MRKTLFAVMLIALLLLSACYSDIGRTGATVAKDKERTSASCDGVEVCVGDDCKVEPQKECSSEN